MHGPRCFLQELPGHVNFCMRAYGEYSSRLRNFGGFKLVTNLKETKEAKCKFQILFANILFVLSVIVSAQMSQVDTAFQFLSSSCESLF